MKAQVSQATAVLECPSSRKNCEVTFEVNVFRGVHRGGLEVKGCSEFFCDDKGAVTCEQNSIRTPEAQELYEQAIRKHQDELSTIGTNVIG